MTTRYSAPLNISLDRAANALVRSLEAALAEQRASDYRLTVAIDDRQKTKRELTLDLRLGLEDRSSPCTQVQLLIMSVGGNVYEVRCRMEKADTFRFRYGLPEARDTESRASNLGQRLVDFLRTTLEKRLGRLLLKSLSRPSPLRA